MTYAPAAAADDDTVRVSRAAITPSAPPRRLTEMDLDPPPGPVPAAVLAYFEAAVAREGRRRAA